LFGRQRLLEEGMISPDDLSLYTLTDNTDEAINEILNFYRMFHSMRYIKNKLVLRLQYPLTEEALEFLNVHFKDILSRGTFVQCGPLGEEQDEPELLDRTRIAFHFNRRSLGRLRQLIDVLNQSEPAR
jgi:hypothetical protein